MGHFDGEVAADPAEKLQELLPLRIGHGRRVDVKLRFLESEKMEHFFLWKL